MSRVFLVAAIAAVLFPGCSSNTPTATVATDSRAASTSDITPTDGAKDAPSAADLLLPDNPGALPDARDVTSTESVAPRFPNPTGYLEEMQKILERSVPAPNEPPTLAAIAEAIKLGDEGRQAYPADENLLRAAAAVRYRFLPLETSPDIMRDRRIELGQLARLLVTRSKDLSELGNMPSILLIEEAAGLLMDTKFDQAWSSIKEARSLGFRQSKLLLLDSIFEPLAKRHGDEIRQWLEEDVAGMFREQESFPFDFSLRTLNGKPGDTVSLADFRGKVVIVDLWGTWCGPCRITIPDLVELQEKYKDDLVVVGVNFEENEFGGLLTFDQTQATLATFTRQQPINYACAYGTPELASKVPGFKGFPTMVFIDRDGKVRLVANGYQPKQLLDVIVSTIKTG